MTINVYPSKLDMSVFESFHNELTTIKSWLSDNIPSFSEMKIPPISIFINGSHAEPCSWGEKEILSNDEINIFIEPKNDTFNLFFMPFMHSKVGIMKYLMPKVDSPLANQNQSGADIDEATATGNKVKLNSPIREIAGKRKIFPDLISEYRRYFAGPREQRVEMLLCVGKGEYETPASKVLIGSTPAISLGADTSFKFYGPGSDLSSDPAHLWWHDVVEVGASSSGSSGLELTTAVDITPGYTATSQQFNGYMVTIPSGAGNFPADWASGLIVQIIVPYQYEFIDGGIDRDIIRGDSLNMLNPEVGDSIQIFGANAGNYIVHSFTPTDGASPAEMTLSFENGNPVTALSLGAIATTIGPKGLRYRITAANTSQITVDRLTSSGATDIDFPGFDFLETALSSIILDPSSLVGGFRGPFAMCPNGEKTTSIEWDIFYPGGLIGVGLKDGYRYTIPSTTYLEWRDMDIAGPWTVETRTFSASSIDSVGVTYRVDLPYPMRAEARVRRSATGSVEWQDACNWYGARCLFPSKKSYEGVTVLTVNARGGDRISAQSESMVSCEVTRKLPTRVNGEWSDPIANRDISSFFGYVAKSVGYRDEDINLVELDRLHELWTVRGDFLDQSINTRSTASAVIASSLAVGFSEVTIDKGLLRPTRDEPQLNFSAMYSPQGMTKGLERDFNSVRPDDYDGVDVEYVDGISWQSETIKCRLPGDNGIRSLKIKAEGCTNKDRAYRIGMRKRRELKYRRWDYRWSTEMSAFNSRYLSYVQVADDVPGYAQSAIMIGYDNGIIESSESFDWSDPAPHIIYVRRPDGSTSGPHIATKIDDFSLSISGLDFTPVLDGSIEPPYLLFGTGYGVLITSISPAANNTANVEGVEYNASVYLDDNSMAPT